MSKALAINLRRLRKIRNVTQLELARMAGISRNAYRSIETGISRPRTSTLHSIARTLKVSVFDLVIEIPSIRNLRFRAQHTLTARERAEREQIAVDVTRWLNDFNSIEEITNDRRPYQFDGISFEREYPVDTAARARSVLKLDENDFINDICSLLEDAGIKIRPMSTSLKRFFGLSVGIQDGGPAIAVNTDSSIPVERQIFATALEFGHLLLHPDSYKSDQVEEDEQQEAEASMFASYFLMPQSHFEKEWSEGRGIHWVDSVLHIKRLFKVSYKTVLNRIVEEGIVDSDICQEFVHSYNIRYNKNLIFKEKPEAYLTRSEEPSLLDRADFVEDRLARLVINALYDRLISFSRAAEILHISVREIRERVVEWGMFNEDQ